MAVDIKVQSATLRFLHSRSFEAREFSTALPDGTRREMGSRKQSRWVEDAAGDCFLRLISFSSFGSKRDAHMCNAHTAQASSVHRAVHRLECVGGRGRLGGTHDVIRGKSLLWLSGMKRSTNSNWICPPGDGAGSWRHFDPALCPCCPSFWVTVCRSKVNVRYVDWDQRQGMLLPRCTQPMLPP